MSEQRVAWRSNVLDVRWEGLRVMALMPFLMFPSVRPVLTLAMLVAWLGFTVAAAVRGVPLWVETPLTWPIVLLLAMVAVGVVVTPYRDLAWPKLAGIMLGVLAVRAVLLTVSGPRETWRTVAVYVVLGCALVAQGAVATSWFAKFAGLAQATSWMPQVITHLPGTAAEGVQPNALAGTVLLILPLTLVLLCGAWGTAVQTDQRTPRVNELQRPWLRPFLVVTTFGLTSLLVVTQSRTAWAAMILTAATLAAIRWRPARRFVLGTGLIALLGLILAPRLVETTAGHLISSSGSLQLSWAGRVEVWQRAVTAISDFPFTGLGLNAFRRVVHDLYPLALSARDFDVAHAHNVFLQTALDTGLPGLVAYVSLLWIASVLAWQVYRKAGPTEGILALGLWGNLLAVHLFGLTDAIALGAKVGLLLWVSIGLIAALHRCTVGAGRTTLGSRRID